eukprot:gb/GECG01013947.1/.p1 GENE.gb/GECG01013947.1/~~gb/GECG01013947.1/.p1  ORF type:complete len:336 (+),score=123.02 gb/GECG01013947.1/:1-1008(+)
MSDNGEEEEAAGSKVEIDPAMQDLAQRIHDLKFLQEFDVEQCATVLKEKLKQHYQEKQNEDEEAPKDAAIAGPEPLHQAFIEMEIDKEVTPEQPAAADKENEEEGEGEGEEGGEEGGEDEGGEDTQEGKDEGEEGGEEGEEGDEEGQKPQKEPVKKEYTKNAMTVFDLFDKEGTGEVDLPELLGTIYICKNGYSEAAAKTTCGFYDIWNQGCAKESHLWKALKLACVSPPNDTHLKHLRRAWRNAEKFGAGEEEEGEEEGEEEEEEGEGGGEGGQKPAKAPQDEETKVMVESFFEALQGDEYLAKTLFQEAEIPVKEAKEGEEDEDEEGEEAEDD